MSHLNPDTSSSLRSSPQEAVTLRDIAVRVGVTKMTVSRALSGGQVSPPVREAILQAAHELGYRPHMGARHMARGRSHQIGVLVRNNSRVRDDEAMSHPLTYEFILGINEGLDAAGYMMSLVRVSDLDPEQHYQSSAFQGHLLDGIIVVNDVQAVTPERLETLFPRCVWLDSNVWRETGCIRRDEFRAGETAARALADLGYREWIVLEHTRAQHIIHHYSYEQRLAGMESVAHDCGVTLQFHEIPWEQDVDWTQLWDKFHLQVGVLAIEPYLAYELQSALLETDLRPGRDFALVCLDDGFHTGGLEWKALSRVTFSRFNMGRVAAQMMIQLLEQPDEPCASQVLHYPWHSGTTARPCPLI
jgi:DNA-binding LacI/PurR family transcriptional regulator